MGYSSTAVPSVPVTVISPATNSAEQRVTAAVTVGPAPVMRTLAVSSTSTGRVRNRSSSTPAAAGNPAMSRHCMTACAKALTRAPSRVGWPSTVRRPDQRDRVQ